jgi:hypothetical protein
MPRALISRFSHARALVLALKPFFSRGLLRVAERALLRRPSGSKGRAATAMEIVLCRALPRKHATLETSREL